MQAVDLKGKIARNRINPHKKYDNAYMRFPGILLAADTEPYAPLLRMVATQIKVPIDAWSNYAEDKD